MLFISDAVPFHESLCELVSQGPLCGKKDEDNIFANCQKSGVKTELCNDHKGRKQRLGAQFGIRHIPYFYSLIPRRCHGY